MSPVLAAAFAPVLDALVGVDLSDPVTASATLDARIGAPALAALSDALRTTHATTPLTPKRATPTLTFGRLAKASPETRGFSIDAVDMEGSGAPHVHPNGEVSWCVPLSGDPRFEGCAAGWAILPPGSRHTPTVTGGRMLIVYFLPDGAMEWIA